MQPCLPSLSVNYCSYKQSSSAVSDVCLARAGHVHRGVGYHPTCMGGLQLPRLPWCLFTISAYLLVVATSLQYAIFIVLCGLLSLSHRPIFYYNLIIITVIVFHYNCSSYLRIIIIMFILLSTLSSFYYYRHNYSFSIIIIIIIILDYHYHRLLLCTPLASQSCLLSRSFYHEN